MIYVNIIIKTFYDINSKYNFISLRHIFMAGFRFYVLGDGKKSLLLFKIHLFPPNKKQHLNIYL